MTNNIINNPLRCGKSIKYNCVNHKKALVVYKGGILPQKKTLPKSLKNNGSRVHRTILYEYKWYVCYTTTNGVGKIFITFTI